MNTSRATRSRTTATTRGPATWLVLLTALVISMPAWSAPSKHYEEPPPGLRAYLKTQMQQRRIPGMQVAVVRGGKLELAAPISRYIDGLPAAWQAITVRQLATHVSGLPDIMNSTTARLIVDGDPKAAWAKVQSLPMEFSTGERFSYNQTNYLLLGKIIDKVGGERFTQFVKERQLDIVGMPHTVYADDRDIVAGSATTYSFMRACRKGEPEPTDQLCRAHVEFPDFLRTAAGLNSTAEEVARWIIALQQGHLFKEKSSLATLWTPGQLNDGSHSPWAMGWPVVERSHHRVYMPSGGGKAAFGIYPDDDLAVVILTNLSWDEPRPVVEGVAAYYIPDLHHEQSSN